ncbi:MAG TPA: hypothetical protein VJ623_02830 [Holophagaceae bacterium]|nr:hypothetical protein [Holophagaceae bacterium]
MSRSRPSPLPRLLLPGLLAVSPLRSQEELPSRFGLGLSVDQVRGLGASPGLSLMIHFAREQPFQGRLRWDFGQTEHTISGTVSGQPWQARLKTSYLAFGYEFIILGDPSLTKGWYATLGLGAQYLSEHQSPRPDPPGGGFTRNPDFGDSDYVGFSPSVGAGLRFNGHVALEVRCVAGFLREVQLFGNDPESLNRYRWCATLVFRP